MRRIVIFLILVCATAAYAGDGTLSVSPAVIMLRGEAGQSTTQRMLLTNGTSRPFSFDLIAEDVVVRNGKRVLVPAGETAGSIAATAVFSQRTVTVPPGGSAGIDVTVTIPPRTPVRAVTALFHGKDRIVRGKVPMTVSLGTLMTFALSDSIGVDAGSPAVTPQSATSNAAFTQPFVNNGTEPFVAKGIAAILDGNGMLVAKAPLESRRVLPGEQVSLHGEFAGELARGKYREGDHPQRGDGGPVKRAILLACLFAAPAMLPAIAAEVGDAGQTEVTVTAGEARQLLAPGVTAAYAVDGTIAEASSRSGIVTISGKSAGTTRVVIVTMEETRTIEIVVVARVAATPIVPETKAPAAAVETHYTSSTRQETTIIDVSSGDEKRRTEVHVMNVNEPRTSFPSASYSIVTPTRRITFFDRPVDNSPLTLSRTSLRGFHLESDTWRIHAGYTGAAFYDGLVLPAQRETVFGASYMYRISPVLRLMPSVFVYPSRSVTEDRRGAVASLLAEYGNDDALRARGEIGISRGIGGAVDLSIDRRGQLLRADVRFEPRRFAGAGPSDLHGFYSDGSWSGGFGNRVSSIVDASANHYILPGFEQRSVTGNAEVRFRATKTLSILGGANYGDFEAIVPSGASTRSFVIPAGVSLDFIHGGLTAIARFGDSSSSSSTRGFRFSGRVSGGGFFATAYFDRQSEAPTLELIFRDRPDLALAIEQLGLTAESPQDIARLLRDNAELINLGFIEGATVDLSLLRTQAGLELAWLSNSAAQHQLRLRFIHDRAERVAFATMSNIATLSYSRRITGTTDVQASLSTWTTKIGATPATRDRAVDVGIRKRFDEMPALGGGTISGMVFQDEEMNGAPGGESRGMDGVEVRLDGGRSSTTDARGRYAFSGVSSGMHHVAAKLPSASSYFTTPSSTEARAGEHVDFGIANTPARVVGSVVSDGGIGVGGVVVALTRGERRIAATSGSDGHFSIAAPPGEWHASIDRDSLPGVYTLSGDGHDVALDRGAPKTLDFTVTAIRSIAGHLTRPGEVEIVELHRREMTDAGGNFLFRSLPAGTFTLKSGRVSTIVALSKEPVSIRDVVLH